MVSIKLMTHQAPTCLSIRPREWFLDSGLVAKSHGGGTKFVATGWGAEGCHTAQTQNFYAMIFVAKILVLQCAQGAPTLDLDGIA